MHAFRTLPPNLRSPPRPLLRCLRHTLASTNSSAAPQATLILAQVSPQSETSTEEAEESIPYHRGSPEAAFGCKRIGCVVLPPDLDLGIKAILEDESKGLLRTDALRIYESFRSTSRLQEDPDDPPPQSKRSGKDKRPSHKSKDATPLSSPTLNPHVIDYGHRESVAYLAGAMSSTYAAVYNVLREIRGRMPTFVPASVFDFGSGPGTALWASREVFPESLASYRGVDISEAMIGVAEKLLTHQTAEHKITNADFQRHFSHDPRQPKTDLVISAFAFGDVPTDAIRISLLESLWNQTGDVLVLIERGTPVGYKMIVKAREWVLQRENGKGGEEGGAHVVAPCPHDGPCPMLGVSNHDWCHFSQRVQRPEFLMKTKRSKINFEDARYSYVVLRRGKRPVAAVKDEASDTTDLVSTAYGWPRLIRPPLKPKKHIIMDVCAPAGHLERMIIPKSQGKVAFYDARKVSWGDLFPHPPKNPGVRRGEVTVDGVASKQSKGEGRRKVPIS